MTSYRYIFYDLRTDQAYAELPMHGARFEWILNKAGAWSGTIPLMDRRVRATDWASAIVPTKNYLTMERNRQLLFGGILWDTNFTDEKDEIQAQGEDIWSYFHHRALHRTYDFIQWEQLAMFNNLISTAQTEVIGGNIGVHLAPYTSTGVIRDRTTYVETQGHYYGDIAENLAAVINGFDFRFQLSRDQAGQLQKQILTGYPNLGRPASTTTIHLNYSRNGHIRNFAWQTQGSVSASRVFALSDQGLIAVSTANDLIAAGFPVIDKINTYSGITTQSVLQAHADADLLMARTPVQVPPIQVGADWVFDQQMWPGDAIRIMIDHPIYFPNPRDAMDGLDHRRFATYRIGSMSLDVDTDVVELTLITNTLAPARERMAETWLPLLSDVQPEVAVA